jgi:hypothetical protein
VPELAAPTAEATSSCYQRDAKRPASASCAELIGGRNTKNVPKLR